MPNNCNSIIKKFIVEKTQYVVPPKKRQYNILPYIAIRTKRIRYEAVVAVSKNIEDPSEIKELLDDLKKKTTH